MTEPGRAGNVYGITGPEALSYADVAAALSPALGREVTYVNVTDAAVASALAEYELDQWFIEAPIGLCQDYRRSGTDGYATEVIDTVKRVTSKPAGA